MATNRTSTGTAPRTGQIDLNKYIQERSNSLNGITAGYGDIFTNYGNGLINNGSFQAIENARQNMLASTNRQYNDAAKNYYTQYRSNQAKLPETLSRLGVTGGGSETAQLGLMNNYSTNLYNNESARRNAINEGNMQYDQQIADNSKAIAQQLADVYLQLALQARDEKAAQEAAGNSYSYSGGGGYYGGSSSSGSGGVSPSGNTPKSTIPKWLTPEYIARIIAKNRQNGAVVVQPSPNGNTGGSGSGTSRGRITNASMYK